ncbi:MULTISPECIES: YciI family protein [Pseudoxanthomonas]|uniref:Uncharacterized protein YciI n=1 Tax=Pseudoxanthomonas winnipegensis TaxID=2480810 RepID=A0A4Q8LIC5_9GAMM|nr:MULTISPECIES: YciI family protein [Pseudoxanthomonas]MDQ1118826.1 uncharacterized protein YciI [Pseudoxanthomonas winnipegensis]MDQ1132014.1 uncharacterized protein YciI [Pseudoxanthomonas winnipegensis]MDR6137973.1 uncharacterized protein YciI [Pseudoxanthomonas sp. SORGH_AS_0997]RZZ87558.1 hypothetical protein EA662_06495 [Pseudoxanthomonas winnipegensis]TAA29695.1 hypothetical protein EA661_09080 [Pseudoxanthomonas winnipegensis]
MKLYLVMAIRKADFPADVVGPHKDWLINLKVEGQLHMAGGFTDGSGGAYILKNLDSLEQAKALVATDPLALRNASELTVYEWNTP